MRVRNTKDKYKKIFRRLVQAYYDNVFENELQKILDESEDDKRETLRYIAVLCGIEDIDESDDNFVYNLKQAITHYKIKENIVMKIFNCEDCAEQTNCKSVSVCPFDAILDDPLPDSKFFDHDLCSGCGLCVDTCDKGRLLDKVEFIPLLELLKNNQKVMAVVAPAITGQWSGVSLDQLRTAFIKIGFTDMIEVAFFADMLTIKEAVEFDRLVNKDTDFMITSCCCPIWVGMLKKVYKELAGHVSPSVSPMIGAGRVLKKLEPDIKVVFIGPCVAKKAEAKEADVVGAIDFVLTFYELEDIFGALAINPSELAATPSIEYASRGGRLYGKTGGVSVAISEAIEELYPEKYRMLKTLQAEGIKECKNVLADLQAGVVNANFIEGMGCAGGCLGGPKVLRPASESESEFTEFAYASAVKVATHSNVMDRILERIDITALEDFRNNEKIDVFKRDMM